MIIPDKKKAATIILSRQRPDGGTVETEAKPEFEMGPDQAFLKSLAEDIMSAIANKSAHDLMTALQHFCAECDEPTEE